MGNRHTSHSRCSLHQPKLRRAGSPKQQNRTTRRAGFGSQPEAQYRTAPIGCVEIIHFYHRKVLTLRTTDLRWNNAGLIGGRALVDLLKWNMVLEDIQLTGNEIPEDLSAALCMSYCVTSSGLNVLTPSRHGCSHLPRTQPQPTYTRTYRPHPIQSSLSNSSKHYPNPPRSSSNPLFQTRLNRLPRPVAAAASSVGEPGDRRVTGRISND